MRPITLYTFGLLNVIYSGCVPLFPAILALWDIWVHVGSTNHGDEAFYIKVSVNDFLSIGTVLCIPNVNSNDCYIRFGQDFNDSRFECKNNIVEYIVVFEDVLDFIR